MSDCPYNFQTYNYVTEGIFVINSNYEVVFWNNTIEQLSGIKSKEIKGKFLLEVFPHLNKNLYKMRLDNVLKGGASEVFSSQIHKSLIPCTKPNGSQIIHHTVVTYMPSEEGKISYAVFSLKDVSEETKRIEDYRKLYKKALYEIEQRMKAEKELIKLNQSKDKFFSIVAHDLKGPFGAVMGLSEFILEDLETMTTEELKELFESLSDSMKNVYELLENLLNWSRLQLGRMEFLPSTIHLYRLVQKVIELLSENARQKNITMINSIPKKILVCADINMINTIFRNLISNAIKFTHNNGEISISITSDKNNLIEIEVKDNGIGMTEEQLEKLFQIDKTHTTVGTNSESGTGLGLILSKDLIERNSGTIEVKSTKGIGSTFSLTLKKYNEKILP